MRPYTTEKINDCYEFPEQLDLDAGNGRVHCVTQCAYQAHCMTQCPYRVLA